MGVGRNLAYQKSLFKEANGLKSHMNIKSGDDDLFINQVATKKNTAICYSPTSFTVSTPKASFSAWFNQKRRHITTANYYSPLHKILLGTYYFSQVLFWLLAIILLFRSLHKPIIIWSVIIAFFLRLLLQYIVIGRAAKKLNERDLIVFIPILDFYLVFIQLMLFINNTIRKPKTW